MCLKNVWFVFGLLITGAKVQSSPECDPSLNVISKEGIIGESQTFPWLGVLRVHLHEGQSMKIALTGIVYVKKGYAIANADDITRIPKRIFKEDSKAMFIPSDETPWYCRLADYMTHPEYEFETINTIALLELDLGDERYFPMKPICWPSYSYNASNQLYAVGYTDENQLLEKFINRLQFVDMGLCQEFYNRAGLSEGKKTPLHYQCGFAEGNKDNCVWDNGMAMVSNSSGYWTLIGLGLHGPGCAAPARFIDMLYYYPWIESATNLQEISDYTEYRRTALDEGFRPKQKLDIEEIPAHELLRSDIDFGKEMDKVGGKITFAHYYPVNRDAFESDMFSIERIEETAINLQRIKDGQIGNCSSNTRLIYRDDFKIKAPGPGLKRVQYKVYSKNQETAYLFYKTEIENTGGQPDIPDVYKVYPVPPRPQPGPTAKPRPHMKPESINDLLPKYDFFNVNVYLKIEFEQEGSMDVRIFGPSGTFRSLTTTTEDGSVPTTEPTTVEI